MERKSIGKFIATLRKAKGLTQDELGELLHVSGKTISSWEIDRSSPDISMIPVIADIFDVTCDELLAGERKCLEEIDLSRKSKIASKALSEREYYGFKNKMLIILIFLVLSIPQIIFGVVFVLNIWGLIILIIGLLIYATGIIVAIIFNNAHKANIDGYNDYNRRSLRTFTRIMSIYSLGLLAPVFYHLMNKELLKSEDYSLNENEKAIILANSKKKVKCSLLFFLPASLVLAFGIVLSCLNPSRFNKQYDVKSIKEMLYTFHIEKRSDSDILISNQFIDYNGGVSTHSNKFETIESGDYTFNVFFGKLKQDTPIKASNDFVVAYSDDNKMAFVSYKDTTILTLAKRETQQKTVYYSINSNMKTYLINEFISNYYCFNKTSLSLSSSWFYSLMVSLSISIFGIAFYNVRKKKIKF